MVPDIVPICYVNGKRYELPSGRAEATLLQWLRGGSLLNVAKQSSFARGLTERTDVQFAALYGAQARTACLTLFAHPVEIHLTGTKLGCSEGGCGACTVMLSHQAGNRLVHRSVNACLCPLYAVEGMHVVTVEGES